MQVFIRFVLLTSILFILTGCPSKNTTPPTDDNNETELQIIDDNTELQTDWGMQLDSLLTVMDTTSAKVELLTQILLDTLNVVWADTNHQGILIEYSNGMRGGIILDFKDKKPGGPEPPSFDTLRVFNKSVESVSDSFIPLLKQFRYMAMAYDDFQALDDDIYSLARSGFQKTGYTRYFSYSPPLNSNCTIAKIITGFNDYGVVHISSHGAAWPNENNIQEVYLQTGETANRATNSTYFDHIRRGHIPIVLYGGSNKYFISPAFLKSHIDISENNTFVYLAFCYSYLGNWHSTLVDSCGALAVIGYDWSVSASYDNWWAKRFYWLMNDTSRTEPLKLSEWYLMQDNSYRNTEANKEVTMRYYGNPDLSLWKPEGEGALSPSRTTISPLDTAYLTLSVDGVSSDEIEIYIEHSTRDYDFESLCHEYYPSTNTVKVWDCRTRYGFNYAGIGENLVIARNRVSGTVYDTSLVIIDLTSVINTTRFVQIMFSGAIEYEHDCSSWYPPANIQINNMTGGTLPVEIPIIWSGLSFSLVAEDIPSGEFGKINVNIQGTLSEYGENLEYLHATYTNIWDDPGRPPPDSLVPIYSITEIEMSASDIPVSTYVRQQGDYTRIFTYGLLGPENSTHTTVDYYWQSTWSDCSATIRNIDWNNSTPPNMYIGFRMMN